MSVGSGKPLLLLPHDMEWEERGLQIVHDLRIVQNISHDMERGLQIVHGSEKFQNWQNSPLASHGVHWKTQARRQPAKASVIAMRAGT